MAKKTLILGASTKPDRYAYQAAQMLTQNQHEIVPVGFTSGEIFGQQIITDRTIPTDIDTITLYLNPKRQEDWYDYILQTKPQRIIFNPGTENPELVSKAQSAGIETEYACTLVMLSVGNY